MIPWHKQPDPNRDLSTEGVPLRAGKARGLKSPDSNIDLTLYTRTGDMFAGAYDTPFRLRVVVETGANDDVASELVEWFRHYGLLDRHRTTSWGALYFDAYLREDTYLAFKLRWL